jgi:hypothetical protein
MLNAWTVIPSRGLTEGNLLAMELLYIEPLTLWLPSIRDLVIVRGLRCHAKMLRAHPST